MNLELSIVVAGLVFVIILIVVAVDWKTSFHSKILAPARRWLLFTFAPLVVDEWNLEIKIDKDGKGALVHEIIGHANFNRNRWLTLGIETDTPQPSIESGQFTIKATDSTHNDSLSYKVLLDEPKYKRVNIFFGQIMERGDSFQMKVEYSVIGTYFFNKPDRHVHRAYHWEKKINFKLTFLDDIRVDWAKGEIVTETGDVWLKHPEAKRHNDHFITWSVDRAGPGNSHTLKWLAKTP